MAQFYYPFSLWIVYVEKQMFTDILFSANASGARQGGGACGALTHSIWEKERVEVKPFSFRSRISSSNNS